MRKYISIFTISIFVILFVDSEGANNTANSDTTYPTVTLEGTHVRIIDSSIMGREFEIFISPPPDYENTQKHYPVVYQLDAHLIFGVTAGAIEHLTYDKDIPGLILIGIVTRDRRNLFTPLKRANRPDTGGAPNFLRFVSEELIPFIDSEYRTDTSDRTLIGNSLGALFVFYTLFHSQDVFNRFVAGTASLGWDNRIVFQYENEYSSIKRDLPVALYVSRGTLEGFRHYKAFIPILKSRQYPSLHLTAELHEGMKHASTGYVSILKGLRAVFSESK
ncbi:hypothetical protein BVY01_04445 [bacterium I07]|nr:hypothetical protein BVY01_04445 [bacterium I07]